MSANFRTRSKMGGDILWPANEPWPVCEQHTSPYVDVLQLRAADVPALPFPDETDLVQILWCPMPHPGVVSRAGPLPQIFYRRSTAIQATRMPPPPPTDAPSESVPRLCALHSEPVIEYPGPGDPALTEEEEDQIVEWERQRMHESRVFQSIAQEWDWDEEGEERPFPIYQYWLSTAPGTKIGGYVDWFQDAEIPVCRCDKEMEHLLTVASWEFDSGSQYRWGPIEEAPHSKFQDDTLPSPARLSIGRGGNLFVFVCRHCQPWQFDYVCQW